MKTLLKITASFIVNLFLLQFCCCQQVKTKNSGDKPEVLVCSIDSVSKTDFNMSDEAKDLSIADIFGSNPEEISIRYQAYKRIRLSENSECIQIAFVEEIEKVTLEIEQNKTDYSKLVYSEKDQNKESWSISTKYINAKYLEKEAYTNTIAIK